MIHLSARQVDDLTAWELMAAVEGWKAANCAEEAPPPTDEEHDALMAKYA